mmetsp:Transcript_27856/g.48344  ORF Transcript_27856/g.48344 Transcript_27856/m.48344 type:complete len:203 (-) Transcript_27856:952-1560(-)
MVGLIFSSFTFIPAAFEMSSFLCYFYLTLLWLIVNICVLAVANGLNGVPSASEIVVVDFNKVPDRPKWKSKVTQLMRYQTLGRELKGVYSYSLDSSDNSRDNSSSDDSSSGDSEEGSSNDYSYSYPFDSSGDSNDASTNVREDSESLERLAQNYTHESYTTSEVMFLKDYDNSAFSTTVSLSKVYFFGITTTLLVAFFYAVP